VARKQPLSFDPISQASENWTNAGWDDAAGGMAFVTSIMRTHQILIARVDECLQPFNLSFARFEVLMLLSFSRTGQLPLGKVGQRLQVHPASVTNAIDRLERDGFVVRSAHPTDGRATLASITRSGRELARAAVEQLNAQVFCGVGLDRIHAAEIVRTLSTLRQDAGDFTKNER
jgi:DNA-binding MarR family transcriptional regulator